MVEGDGAMGDQQLQNNDTRVSRPCGKRPRASKNHSANANELSHTLSWILRHHAINLGLHMTPDGYVQVHEILKCQHPRVKGRNWTEEDIRHVVESCRKQRYKLEMKPASIYATTPQLLHVDESTQNGDAEVLCIRANQGHSIKTVDSDLLLERLTGDELLALPVVVHGTFKDAWENCIRTQGLSRMTRNHIHFATGLPQDGMVISGMRKTCEVYVYVNTKTCAVDNIPFFRSENGVILCSGLGDKGILPVSYFSEVTDSSGRSLLDTSDT
jgi:RNA:NAD 2'-phosphotransferase (TPT1/KptA family)